MYKRLLEWLQTFLYCSYLIVPKLGIERHWFLKFVNHIIYFSRHYPLSGLVLFSMPSWCIRWQLRQEISCGSPVRLLHIILALNKLGYLTHLIDVTITNNYNWRGLIWKLFPFLIREDSVSISWFELAKFWLVFVIPGVHGECSLLWRLPFATLSQYPISWLSVFVIHRLLQTYNYISIPGCLTHRSR
jgi:hypothetical protein